MPNTIGYIENWRPIQPNYFTPYDVLVYSFITLSPTDGTGKPPPLDKKWDGSFYYATSKIVYNGAIYTGDKFSTEGLRALSTSFNAVKNSSKQFSISIGGWSDLQNTPNLTDLSAKDNRDAIVNNLGALSSYLNIVPSQLYVDFDWEHLGFHIGSNGEHVNVKQTDKINKCLFLGWTLAAVAKAGFNVSYTTRVNSFYPFQQGKESDVEGVIVSYGSLFNEGAGAVDFVSKILDKIQSKDYTPNVEFFKTIKYINLMAYDGATGLLARNGCYTLSDYRSIVSALTTTVGAENLDVFVVGFEPIRQASECIGARKMCSSACLLDTQGIQIETVEKIWNIFENFGGISIWAVNETGFSDYINSAEAGFIIADLFQVVMGNKQPCGTLGQIRVSSGDCVDPYCLTTVPLSESLAARPERNRTALHLILVISILLILYAILSFFPAIGFTPLSAVAVSLGPALLVLYAHLRSIKKPVPKQNLKYNCMEGKCVETVDGLFLESNCNKTCGPSSPDSCSTRQIKIRGQCVECAPKDEPKRDGSRGSMCQRAGDCSEGLKCLNTNKCPEPKDGAYLCRTSYNDCIFARVK